MSIEILEKVFGSSARVKLMKLFFFNPEEILEKAVIVQKTKTSATIIQKEIKNLLDINLLKKRTFIKSSQTKSGKTKKQKIQGYILNQDFKLFNNLKNLVMNNSPLQDNEIIKRLNRAGKIRLIVVSGIFMKEEDSRIDLLVVGDDIKDRVAKTVIAKMESEIGKELTYSVFSTADFKYRYGICDRLVRDIFDYPHRIVVDRIGL